MRSTASVETGSLPLLEPVLAVLRDLGGTIDLEHALGLTAQAVVDILDFGVVSISVLETDGSLRVESVAGPPAAQAMRGERRPAEHWLAVLDRAEPCGPTGELRFHSHELDRGLMDEFLSWLPDGAPDGAGCTDWHPEDVLLAPLWDADRKLIGVIAVEQPDGGRRPDADVLALLELLAIEAGHAVVEAVAASAAEARRRGVEALWRAAFDSSVVGAVLLDSDGEIREINEALLRMLGYGAPAELIGRTALELTHPEDREKALRLRSALLTGGRETYSVERRMLRADGTSLRAHVHSGVVRGDDGRVTAILVQIEDITSRTRAERRLARQATHDWLTDLPNRALLEQILSECLASGRPAGVLFCDVDRFKVVNDSLGHDAGDELLLLVAHRLSTSIPDGWTLGRVGGDEFVVIAPGEGTAQRLHQVGVELAGALRRPFVLRGYRHTVEMSVGAAVSAPWHRHADEVLREADQALSRAKRHGRGRIEVYDATQDRPATVEDLRLESELRSALADGGLQSYFQPVVSAADSTLVGMEALARWRHPVRGLLLPADFLPLADATGLVVPLGWAMLELACRAARRWSSVDGRWVAVNASGRQLGRGLLPTAVRRALDETGVRPQSLHIEITETALVEASAAGLRELHAVADMGICLSLDDFGTGYSSLSLLRDLPVSTVKIDRSFVAPITRDQRAAAIVRSVVGLCSDLGITTIAEGVETGEQLAVVRALGCQLAQGYLFGAPEPLAPADAEALGQAKL